ncbi:oxoglutarate/iron-dependent oxygenase [Usnea florida]
MSALDLVLKWPVTTVVVSFVLYGVLLCAYRLTLHPLAQFPGPRLAAVTFFYEFYHDYFRGGQYLFHIRDMHAKYGHIVRISPDELHINDPSFLPELMPAGGRRRDKYPRMIQVFGFSQAAGATADHDLHRTRRAAMSKMFTKDSVRKLEPIMRKEMDQLLGRLKEFQEDGREINLLPMFGAFTNDVISEYAYGYSLNWVQAPQFNSVFFDMITGFHDLGPFAVQFKWFMPMFQRLPRRLILKINPGFETFVRFRMQLFSNVERISKAHREGKDSKTVFDEMLDSKLSEEDKKPSRLVLEAMNFSIAGTETSSWILSIMTVHILENPRVVAKLRAELKAALPDPNEPLSIKDTEQLPYLSAVITEGMRLAMGTSQRQTRINPNEVWTYNDGNKQWSIPPGTPVGMSAPLIHLNPDIFDNPMEFRPERFIENPLLKRNLMTFSMGSRQCLGMNLAYGEIFLILSQIWRRFGSKEDHGEDGWWELFETDRSDADMASDRFVPYPKADSKGIRIKVCK